MSPVERELFSREKNFERIMHMHTNGICKGFSVKLFLSDSQSFSFHTRTTDDVISSEMVDDNRVGVVPLFSLQEMQSLLPMVTVIACPRSLINSNGKEISDMKYFLRKLTFAL